MSHPGPTAGKPRMSRVGRAGGGCSPTRAAVVARLTAGFGVYSATKFAVEGLSEALYDELAPLGIPVTVIEPGYFRTDFLDGTSLQKTEAEIDDYAATAGVVRARAGHLEPRAAGRSRSSGAGDPHPGRGGGAASPATAWNRCGCADRGQERVRRAQARRVARARDVDGLSAGSLIRWSCAAACRARAPLSPPPAPRSAPRRATRCTGRRTHTPPRARPGSGSGRGPEAGAP